jgi:predicted AAA+ superfamily ATPase
MLVDHVAGLKIVATGSSSFDLAKASGEPLTGRKYTLLLPPLAQLELSSVEAAHETAATLELRLLYGSYPEVVLLVSNAERERYLKELVSAYLYKDILQIEDVRRADKLKRLLQLPAFQIGREVSVSELGTQLGISKNTVDRYLDLLEKVFVIYVRRGFSRNPRKEISRSRRYYFYDNGIRNTLINNFNPLSLRDDTGALWENYAVTERLEANLYLDRQVESAFWRTYTQQEVDLVEQRGGRLDGFEFKWRPSRSTAAPGGWTRGYPEASFSVVHKDNYMPFVNGSVPEG